VFLRSEIRVIFHQNLHIHENPKVERWRFNSPVKRRNKSFLLNENYLFNNCRLLSTVQVKCEAIGVYASIINLHCNSETSSFTTLSILNPINLFDTAVIRLLTAPSSIAVLE